MTSTSQGIVIPIQAKIEGWQNSIKEIQAAFKKINLGSDVGKDLEKSLASIIKQVNAMGNNLNQRFTSENAITGFYDKVNQIDEAFASLGQTIHGVTFDNLDTSYVTSAFKDLIAQIDAAKTALNTGLEQGFKNALDGTQYIQKALDRLQIDPSKLSMNEIKEALQNASVELAANVDELIVKVDEARQHFDELKKEAQSISTRGENNITDPQAMAQSLLGSMSAQDFGLKSKFSSTLEDIKKTVSSGLDVVGNITEKKRKEIDEQLEQLISAKTVEEARAQLTNLAAACKEIPTSFTKLTNGKVADWSKQLAENVFDKKQFDEAIDSIKEKLANLNFSDDIIKKIVGSITPEKVKEAFDTIPDVLATSLERAKNIAGAALDEINAKGSKAEETLRALTSEQWKTAATRNIVDNANKEYETLYAQLKQDYAALQKRVDDLQKALEAQATSSVTNTGSKISGDSKQQLLDNANAANVYKTALERVQSAEQMVGKLQGVVQRWFSVYSAVRMVGNAIRSIISTTKELDKTITEIAIVTNMDQSQLWSQMPQYTAMAREYAASISGVYEVSQLYYQQGLQTADVMALTEQTLKMARISGLDYADATNYMTNALRSFKMEMTEAQTIVDVYSAVAASSATNTTELATAMSKTASSAQAVGSSFENTTAMMAVMIEATRESATNIGSAMKSIISRYGEMTSNPQKLIDSEGEEMSLNRVDKALQTIGITIHDTTGQFRNFDDVIMELAEKWDTVDKNTQRYIATIMAGNRQQSRFLALVSSYDRLKELSATAADSEDASQLQFLKTLDSIGAKTQQLQTSIQSLYTESGIETIFKGMLDYTTQLINTLGDMPKVFGLPIPAIISIGTNFANLATIVSTVFGLIKARVSASIAAINGQEQAGMSARISMLSTEAAEKVTLAIDAAMKIVQADATITEEARAQSMARLQMWREEAAGRVSSATNATKTSSKLFQNITRGKALGGLALQMSGLIVNGIAGGMESGIGKGIAGMAGNAMSYAGMAYSMTGSGIVAAIAAAGGAIQGLIENWDSIFESTEARAKRLQDAATEANNERIKKNAAYNDLKSEVDQVKELEKTYHDSTEAKKEYYEHSNAIAEQYPMLVSAYDNEGNAILNLANSYEILKEARDEASDTAIKSASKSIEAAEEAQKKAEENYSATGGNILYTNLGNQNNWVIDFKRDESGNFAEVDDELAWLSQQAQLREGTGQVYTLSALASDLKFQKLPGVQLNKIFETLSYNEFDELYTLLDSEKELSDIQNEIEELEDSGVKEAVKFLFEKLTAGIESIGLLSEEGAMKTAEATTKAVNKSSIALLTQQKFADATLEAQYNNGISADYLSEFSAIGTIINDKIYSLWESEKNKNKNLKFEDFAKQTNVTQTYTEIMSEIDNFWESLNSEEQTDLNNLIANRKQYNSKEFEEYLKTIPGLMDETGKNLVEWAQELLKYYEDSFNITKFNDSLIARQDAGDYSSELNLILENRKQLLETLGPSELSNMLKLYDSLVDKIQNGSLSVGDATNIYAQYIDAFTSSNDQIQQILSNVDLFSFTSLSSAIETLSEEDYGEEASQAIEALKAIMHLIPINLNTEIQTIISQFTEGLSDFENSIKNATKGMNFKTMSEEVQKLGLEFNDFNLKDGKYYIKNYQELANKLTENLVAPINDLSNELDAREAEAKEKFSSIDTTVGDILDEGAKNNFASFLKIDLKELDSLYEDYLLDVLEENDVRETDFFTWYYNAKRSELTKTVGEAKRYANDLLARSALESSMLEVFVELAFSVDEAGQEIWKALSDDDKQFLIQAIASGDISSLTDNQRKYFEQYSTLIASTYKSIQSSIADSMISAVGGGSNKITITENNIETIKQMGKNRANWFTVNTDFDNLQVNDTVSLNAEELAKDTDGFLQWLKDTIIDESERLKKYQEYYKNQYSNNAMTSFTKIVDKDSFSLEDYQQYLQTVHNASVDYVTSQWQIAAESMGLSVNAAGQLIIADYEKWARELEWAVSVLESEGASTEEINNAKTILANAKTVESQTQRSAIEDIVKNYTAVTNTQKETLADALKIDVDTLKPYFKLNDDGITSTFDYSKFTEDIKSGDIKLADEVYNHYLALLKNITDDLLTSITKGASYVISGTTSQLEMDAFTELYNNKMNSDHSTIFEYDEITNTWYANAIKMRKFAYEQAKELVSKGLLDANEVSNYIDSLLIKPLAEQVDVDSYLAAENKSQGSVARRTIENQLQRWAQAKWGKEASQLTINSWLSDLEAGSERAVEFMSKLYADMGKELTTEEAQKYYAPLAEKYSSMAAIIAELTVGQYVTGDIRDELDKVGAVDKDGVITSIQNMAKVYKSIYDQMKDAAGATTAQLNSIYASYLTAGEQDEINAISILGDAMGMTYDSLGTMLATYGKTLEEVATSWEEYGISQIGNGKIRIDDFAAFAEGIGLSQATASEEYISAFKTYNDSLIALDRKTESTIAAEIKSITEAKAGERINLTTLDTLLQKNVTDEVYGTLQQALAQVGVYLQDGIATISKNANIADAIKAITENELVESMLLPSELAELQDAVNSLLTNMISLIKNGISGTLNNSDANSLKEFAKNLGVEISFHETAEGLQLSTASAMELYLRLKDIDKLQAQSLLPEISKMSDNYSSLSSACERYNKLINTNTKSLQAEKTVLEDLVKSMMTSPDSYNFMSGSLPTDWQYAKNYLENMEDARTKLVSASKAGYMDATDFYNIVSTAGAYNADFSINGMTADQLISAAGGHLTTKNGTMVVDLSAKTGLSLGKNGYQNLYTQLRTGLEQYTAITEAYYSLGGRLSTISSYINSIDNIDLGKVFTTSSDGSRDNFNKAGKDYLAQIKSMADDIPELSEAFEEITIGGTNLMNLVNSADWSDWQKAGFTHKTFEGFFKNISEVDWSDATQYASQVSELFKESGLSLTIDTGDYSFVHLNPSGNILSIDLTNTNLRNKVVKEYNEIFGKGSVNAKTITETLEKQVSDLESLPFEDKIKVYRVLNIAEEKFDASKIKKNEDGTWSYTYNGKTFTSGENKNKKEAQTELEEAIARASMAEDEGFNIEVEGESTVIHGTKRVGGATIDLTYDTTGEPNYAVYVGGRLIDECHSYEEAQKVLIAQGVLDKDQKPGQTIELDGKQYTTKVDAHTGLAYTVSIDDDGNIEYKYEGRTFNSLKDLKKFLKLRQQYDTENYETLDDKTILHITENASIEVSYDSDGNMVTTYKIRGREFNAEQFAAWTDAEAEEGAYVSLDSSNKKQLIFSKGDIKVTLTVDTEGNIKYDFLDPVTGYYFSANSKAGYEAALAGYTSLTGKTIEGGNADYTIVADSNIKYVVHPNGEIEVVDNEGNAIEESEWTDKIKEDLEKLKSNETIPVQEGIELDVSIDPNLQTKINKIQDAIDSLKDKTVHVTVTTDPESEGDGSSKGRHAGGGALGRTNAKGNVALASGTRSTLMGELGPELWVSNGHYYIAGRHGAEFVDLPTDAIVFNHLQTARLLTNGASGRGRPITNDRAAVALAKGSWSGGPARVDPPEWKTGGGGSTTISVSDLSDDAKSKLSTLISDILSKGFENIDWTDYEEELSAYLQNFQDTAAIGSYRAFIESYGDLCDKTITEINELYFQAWQKDLEVTGKAESQVNAIQGMTYYQNGIIAGSSSDWTAIIGDRAKVGELVQAGVMTYNAALKQYEVTNAEALKAYGVDIESITGYTDAYFDSLATIIDDVSDALESGITGSLTRTELTTLVDKLQSLGVTTDITKNLLETSNGVGFTFETINAVLEDLKSQLGNDNIKQYQYDEITDKINDSISEYANNVADLLEKGLSGTLSNADVTSLKDVLEFYNIDGLNLSFNQTVNGLKLSTEQAATLYSELSKIDSITAQITLNKLVESLMEADDHYKTMTSTLDRIYELKQLINQEENEFNSTKINQYKQELALAEEIATVRATTEDESMNWFDAEIPAALNNPLNFFNSTKDAIEAMRTGASEGLIAFEDLYNIANQINKTAYSLGTTLDFCGYELDGSAAALTKIVSTAAGALGTIDVNGTNKSGVILEKMGLDLTEGAESYGNSVETVVHTMAQSQIELLDSLIAMMEVVVAMEGLEKVDLNMDQWLDFDEMFNFNGKANQEFTANFKAWVDSITSAMDVNSEYYNAELTSAMNGFIINGTKVSDIVSKDAAAWTDFDKKVIQAFYYAYESVGYDLDKLSSSKEIWLEGLAKAFNNEAVTYSINGTAEVTVSGGVEFKMNDNGKYVVNGEEYTTVEQAKAATLLSSQGVKNIKEQETVIENVGTFNVSGTMEVGERVITVLGNNEDENNTRYINSSGQDFGTLEDLYRAEWQASGSELSYDAWKIEQKITIIPTIGDVKADNINQTQINNAIGKTYEEVRAEWNAAKGDNDNELEFEAKYGLKFTENTTEEDWENFKVIAGIETKNIEVNASINIINQDDAAVQALMAAMSSATGEGVTTSETVTTDTSGAVESMNTLSEAIDKVIKAIQTLNELKVAVDTGKVAENVSAIGTAADNTKTSLEKMDGAADTLEGALGTLNGTLSTLWGYLSNLSYSSINVSVSGQNYLSEMQETLDKISEDLEKLEEVALGGPITLEITTATAESTDSSTTTSDDTSPIVGAKGNVSFAAGSRSVLMGELGPELYVTNGHYYIAGRNGAEFVDLPNDAIVFNHLQTQKLLSTGTTGRGRPITNEYAAVSFARGTGIAMATAAETLETLKQLRAMWQSLLTMSITDIAGTAKAEASTDNSASPEQIKTWLKEVERWYNWMQRIAELEREITYEEKLRARLNSQWHKDGEGYADSQLRTMKQLTAELAVQNDLNRSREAYANSYIDKIAKGESAFSKIYTVNPDKTLSYNNNNYNINHTNAAKAYAISNAQQNANKILSGILNEYTKNTNVSSSVKQSVQDYYNKPYTIATEGASAIEQSLAALDWSSIISIDNAGYGHIISSEGLSAIAAQMNTSAETLANAILHGYTEQAKSFTELADTVADEYGGSFALLADLVSTDANGNPKYTVGDQYKILQNLFGDMQVANSSGTTIKAADYEDYQQYMMDWVSAVMDQADAVRQKVETMATENAEGRNKSEELLQKIYELASEIFEKQIEVENTIRDAIETREQAIIDELQKERDALEKSQENYITGLRDALNNERNLYNNNKTDTELDTLRRQLSILQRSGGSSSAIRNLQQQIDAKSQEAYFSKQEEAINALEDASKTQIEKLDQQITIMTESLEYAKEHGLLWTEVRDILDNQDNQWIVDFVLQNTAEYDSKSALEQEQLRNDIEGQIEWYKAQAVNMPEALAAIADGDIGKAAEALGQDISSAATYEGMLTTAALSSAVTQMSNNLSSVSFDTITGGNTLSDVVGAINGGFTKMSDTTSSAATQVASTTESSIKGTYSNYSGSSNSGSVSTSGTGLNYDPKAFYNYNASMLSGVTLEMATNWSRFGHAGGPSRDLTGAAQEQLEGYLTGIAERMSTLTGLDIPDYKDYDYSSVIVSDENERKHVEGLKERYEGDAAYIDNQLSELEKQMAEYGLTDDSINPFTGKTYGELRASYEEQKATDEAILANLDLIQYSKGGSVRHTGLVAVHGTPQDPEYFLDAEETKMWKSDILGSNSSSLTSRLLALRDMLDTTSTIRNFETNNHTDAGVTIEKAEINLQIAEVANDYDARRIGTLVMDEIVQIARKSGSTSVRR